MAGPTRLIALLLMAAAVAVPPPDPAPSTTAVAAPVSAATAGPPVAARAGDDRTAHTVGVLVSDDRQCTATVVTSDSGSVLVTAAHCVYRGGRWHLDRARFLPGFHDGQAPYGEWDVDSAWVPDAWRTGPGRGTHPDATTGAPVHDVAFLRLLPDERGRTAQDVLGSQGIRFDIRPGRPVSVYGYPTTGRYDGRSLRRCTTTTSAVALPSGTAPAAGCGLTAGASGGPWLYGPDAADGDGQVGGVTSLLEDGTGRNIATPFDAGTRQVYDAADRGRRG